jgi:hypothetical protein
MSSTLSNVERFWPLSFAERGGYGPVHYAGPGFVAA